MKIGVTCTKGGTVKTTSAIMLARAMTDRGMRVQVWDADPQGDATGWAEMAADNEDPLPFDVIPVNARSVRRPVPMGIDHALVDTNPHTPEIVQATIDTADFVIIPTTASPLDMARTWATLDTTAGRPARILITRAEPHTIAHRETLAAIDSERAPRFSTVIKKATAIKAETTRNPRSLYGYDHVLTELMEHLS